MCNFIIFLFTFSLWMRIFFCMFRAQIWWFCWIDISMNEHAIFYVCYILETEEKDENSYLIEDVCSRAYSMQNKKFIKELPQNLFSLKKYLFAQKRLCILHMLFLFASFSDSFFFLVELLRFPILNKWVSCVLLGLLNLNMKNRPEK